MRTNERSVWPRRRPNWYGLALGLLLGACAATPAAPGVDAHFEQHQIDLGEAPHQTILTGDFLGDTHAELAVVHVGAGGARRVRVFAFDGRAWAGVLAAALGDDVRFVDVANIGGRDRLIAYAHADDAPAGRLIWFDPDAALAHPLFEVATRYRQAEPGWIPHIDITRDLNGDGRDDIVVPDVDGFRIALQTSAGGFDRPVQFGPPEPCVDAPELGDGGLDETRRYGEVGITAFTAPLYLGRVHRFDADGDGLPDLAFWRGDRFDVHLQTRERHFAAIPEPFSTEAPFDADGLYTHAFEFEGMGVGALLFGLGRKIERTMLHAVRDMNGDGVEDLVTLALSGRSPFRQRSVYAVHFGTATPEGLRVAPQASTSIRPDGKAGAGQLWGYAAQVFEDLDGDGQVDMALMNVDMGFGAMLRALTVQTVRIDLAVWRMRDGRYPDAPDFTHTIRTEPNDAAGQGPFFPPVHLADLNGDGRADLVAGSARQDVLDVFLGNAQHSVFAAEPLRATVALPGDGESTRVADLDADGKDDLLMHHRRGRGPQRLIILFSRL